MTILKSRFLALSMLSLLLMVACPGEAYAEKKSEEQGYSTWTKLGISSALSAITRYGSEFLYGSYARGFKNAIDNQVVRALNPDQMRREFETTLVGGGLAFAMNLGYWWIAVNAVLFGGYLLYNLLPHINFSHSAGGGGNYYYYDNWNHQPQREVHHHHHHNHYTPAPAPRAEAPKTTGSWFDATQNSRNNAFSDKKSNSDSESGFDQTKDTRNKYF